MAWKMLSNGDVIEFVYEAATSGAQGAQTFEAGWVFTVIATLFFPVVIACAAFTLWWFLGRDPEGKGVVITEFEEPNKLPPAMLAILFAPHRATQERTLGSTFLDWARRGIVEITVKSGTHPKQQQTYLYAEVTKKQSLPDSALLFERVLMERAFVSSEQINARTISGFVLPMKVSEALYEELATRHLFVPLRKTLSYGFVIGGVGLFALSGFFAHPVAMFSCLLTAVVLFIFGALLPKTTPHGAVVREKVLGFRKFLVVTEVIRLQELFPVGEGVVHDIPELLPSAVALGLDARWATLFEPFPEHITPMELLAKKR